MITLFVALSLAPATPPSDHLAPIRPAPDCTGELTKVKAAAPVGFTRLGDLPDAHLEIAVNRVVHGCPAPLIVRYDVSK